jgi:hypothetical protein
MPLKAALSVFKRVRSRGGRGEAPFQAFVGPLCVHRLQGIDECLEFAIVDQAVFVEISGSEHGF